MMSDFVAILSLIVSSVFGIVLLLMQKKVSDQGYEVRKQRFENEVLRKELTLHRLKSIDSDIASKSIEELVERDSD